MARPTPRCRLEISIERYDAAHAQWPRIYEDYVQGPPARLVTLLRGLADEIEAGLLTPTERPDTITTDG